MNATTTYHLPSDWRALVSNLCISDERTNGQPVLPPGEAERVREYLSLLLVDFRALAAHVELLQAFYRAPFHSPLPRRFWCDGKQPLNRTIPAPGFPHNQFLPEEKAKAIAELGIGSDVLNNHELAVLLLNPGALWDVYDLIDATFPETWLQGMDRVGRELMAEMEAQGLDLSIPGVPNTQPTILKVAPQ